ncbi:MAG TPA: cytochrome c oxidase assembly protein [Solirubrobacteraceae bacterium]|jgi:putative membrane protein|nr:cytochrome c oxidase assembly protein [Solirubrobacteraceae bacterium]
MPTLSLTDLSAPSAALELGIPAIVGVLYARRTRALARGAQPVRGWRQACFYVGLAVIGATLTALASAGRQLAYVHTIEQLLLGDVAPLLIALGLTGPLLAPLGALALGSLHPFERLRALADPLVAFPLWSVDLLAWHLSTLNHAALRHGGVHALEHVCLVGFGIDMWVCLLGPLPRARALGEPGKLLYVLAVRVSGAILANVLLWSGTVLYPVYVNGEALHRISPVADQNIAGAIMLAEQAIVTLGLFCWLFLRAGANRPRSGSAPEPAASCQPPATAGRIVSSAPSSTGVASPSRKRMSSPAR